MVQWKIMASARTIPGSAYVSEAADSNIMAAFECFRTLRYAVAVPAMIQMIQVTMASRMLLNTA